MSITRKKGILGTIALALTAAMILPPLAAYADEMPPEETTVSEEVTEESTPSEDESGLTIETQDSTEPEESTPSEDTPEEEPLQAMSSPMAFSAASAVTLIGTVGELLPWSSATNQPSYWEDYGPHDNAVCYSHSGNSDHGSITDGGKTVTLNTYGASWPGDHWELLVVKGGSVSNNVIVHPTAGVAYASPLNDGGQQSNVSHWIVCKGTTPDDPDPEPPTQDLTCEAITVDYNRPLKSGDHINMTINGSQPVNAYVDLNVAGGYNTLGLRINGHDPIPLTQAQVESGVLVYNYASYLDTTTFTVEFVQTNETDTWPNFECGEPPTNQVCTTFADGGTSTNLDAGGWVDYDTRATGSATYVNGGLFVATTGSTSTDKVSWAHAFPTSSLALLGDLDVDFTNDHIGEAGWFQYEPGLNVFVNLGNGVTGTLVSEEVYGHENLWVPGGASNAGLRAAAPHDDLTGQGSNFGGTINEWLALYPDATFNGFAFAAGSGVHIEGTLHSVTIGCTTYSFDHEEEPPTEGVYPTVTVIPEYCEYETGGVTGGSISVDGGEDVKSVTVYDENMVEQTDLTNLPAGEYTVVVVFNDGSIAPTVEGWTVDPNDPATASTTVTVEKVECPITKPVVEITESVCVEGSASDVTVTVTATPGVTSEYRINDGTWTAYTGPFTAQAGDEIDVRHQAPPQYVFPNGKDTTKHNNLVVNTPDCVVPVEVTAEPSVTAPTCDAAGTLVVPTIDHVIFAGGTNGAGPGTYTITASAEEGYALTGDTGPWELTVLGKKTGAACDEDPVLALTGGTIAGGAIALAILAVLGGAYLVTRQRRQDVTGSNA